MKKVVDCKIKDKNTLILEEDAQKGDTIELNKLINIDLEPIKEAIVAGRDKVYKEFLEKELKIALATAEIEKEKLKKEQQERENTIKEENNNKILALQGEIDKLRYSRIANVKRIGENLEHYCDETIKKIMQNGFQTCRWYKDNVAITNENESMGTKADFIFEVYNDEEKTELLSNICLEMKSEDVGTEKANRQKNSKFYSQLNSNKLKKNCEYALLVSELEMDNPNDNVVYKVPDYNNMYQIRPAFLESFLNLFVSFVLGFGKIIKEAKKPAEKLKLQSEVIEEFRHLKEKYLEKPLFDMAKKIEETKRNNEEILKNCQRIIKIVDNNNEIANRIISKNIDEAIKSISNFAEKIKLSSRSEFGKKYKVIDGEKN